MKSFSLPNLSDVLIEVPDDQLDEFEDRRSPGNEDGHYRGKVQPIDLIRSQKLSFQEGNVVKLVCRYKDKDGALDLGKLVYYVYQLIDEWVEDHPEDADTFDREVD